jgi:AraC-like DNA-binding protein
MDQGRQKLNKAGLEFLWQSLLPVLKSAKPCVILGVLYESASGEFLAKIAVALEQALDERRRNGAAGGMSARVLAEGDGWRVADVVCTHGPQDRPFEEQNPYFAIAIIVAGSFQYRGSNHHAAASGELMTPGSLLLGNAGQPFECGHEHGAGDRCIAFTYSPDYFERLAADAGLAGGRAAFRRLRLPPLRALAPILAHACAGLGALTRVDFPWEELSLRLAARALQLAGDAGRDVNHAPLSTLARVTRSVRMIERRTAEAEVRLGSLAREAGLSPYHFLRTFEQLTGLTPHQYVLRARLREAATRLAGERGKVLDIALDCGFSDVSNFNRAFRTEFGVSPRVFRRKHY